MVSQVLLLDDFEAEGAVLCLLIGQRVTRGVVAGTTAVSGWKN